MSSASLIFRAGAFVALLLLVRHTWRTQGAAAGAVFLGYLAAFACFREVVVWLSARARHEPLTYVPLGSMGHIGVVNVVVVAGWMFTVLLGFGLAKLIQRKNFPGSNIFLTPVLTALVTSAIGYSVEVTGIRIGLWRWTHPLPIGWLPFDCPFDVLDAWCMVLFMTVALYCAVRFRLLAGNTTRSLAVLGVLLAVFWISLALPDGDGFEGKFRPAHQKVIASYMVLSTVLGFVAPRWMLGSSESALR